MIYFDFKDENKLKYQIIEYLDYLDSKDDLEWVADLVIEDSQKLSAWKLWEKIRDNKKAYFLFIQNLPKFYEP